AAGDVSPPPHEKRASPAPSGSWRLFFGGSTAVGLSAAAGLAGTLAARACVVAWWQNLGAAGAWIEVLGTLAGAGLGVALVLALLRLLTDALALRRLASLPGQPESPTRTQVLCRGLVAVLLLVAFRALVLIALLGLNSREVSPPGSGFPVR